MKKRTLQWLPSLLAALLFTAPFWFWPLDLAAAKIFYHPGVGDSWPLGQSALAIFFYRAAPVLSILLGGSGLALLLAGSLKKEWRSLRLKGLCVFLTLALGPGLLVNGLLKDHMGRPRPRQVLELGGAEAYRPPLLWGAGEGKSFPCGHCSVGFAFGVFALLAWRRHRGVALVIFALSLVLGAFMGVGRMAAGAHFLSDVLWAGLVVWGVIALLHFGALKIPEREAHPERFPALEGARSFWTVMGIPVLAILLLGAALLATPYQQRLTGSFEGLENGMLTIASQVPTEVAYVKDGPALFYSGSFKGFGFPGRKIKVRAGNVLSFYKSGLFTELEGTLRLEINSSKVGAYRLESTR